MEGLLSSEWFWGAVVMVLALLWFIRLGTKLMFGVVKAVVLGVAAFALFKYLT